MQENLTFNYSTGKLLVVIKTGKQRIFNKYNQNKTNICNTKKSYTSPNHILYQTIFKSNMDQEYLKYLKI